MDKKMWNSFLKMIHFSPCHPRPLLCHPREGGDPEKQTKNNAIMLNLFKHLRIKKIPKQSPIGVEDVARDDSVAYSWIPAFAGMTKRGAEMKKRGAGMTREGNVIRLTT